jgi:sulfate/thiosulfate transport system permease protein
LMQEQGSEEEQAAISLGASGLQSFWRVTLPNIRWGLLYGVILCNARAMGEYGAVAVVAGGIRGRTNTVPLQIEQLYNDHDRMVAAFAMASLLAMLGVVTLIVKTLVEWKIEQQLRETLAEDEIADVVSLASQQQSISQNKLEPTTAEGNL